MSVTVDPEKRLSPFGTKSLLNEPSSPIPNFQHALKLGNYLAERTIRKRDVLKTWLQRAAGCLAFWPKLPAFFCTSVCFATPLSLLLSLYLCLAGHPHDEVPGHVLSCWEMLYSIAFLSPAQEWEPIHLPHLHHSLDLQ